MKRALVVGINYYEKNNIGSLYGCVNDALALKPLLERHSNGEVNFGVKELIATSAGDAVSRGMLRDHIQELFAYKSEIALLYFAGHGYIDAAGGYLCGSDCQRGDDGLALAEILAFAVNSPARNKVVLLDSCHSGVAGNSPAHNLAELSEGMTILTASTKEQYAAEDYGCGLFTSLLVDGLSGAAGNLVGDVTPGSVYAHIDQSLGPWMQRPVFKTNVSRFVSLRKVQPPIALGDLQRIAEFFPVAGHVFPLDPTFEPELAGRPDDAPPPDPANTARFAILQKYNRVNLLVPAGAPHMWHAAMQSKGCKLTVLGEHYRRLVEQGLI